MNKHLEGSTGNVAIEGGYLYIYLEQELLSIVSIPRPNFLGGNHNQSIVDNTEDFEDDQGNEYSVIIHSSMHGIEWEMEKYPEDKNLISRIRYDVKFNEN